MKNSFVLFCFIPFLILGFNTHAESYPTRPSGYVTDNAKLLSSSELGQLNQLLKKFEDSTSVQLFVYITPSLNGKVMADVCQSIFHEWKIGQKDKNNGVLISVFVNDHKFRIHTGYGIEGALPDVLTNRIQTETMRPLFKKDKYFEGLKAGIEKIIFYTSNEYSAMDYDAGNKKTDYFSIIAFLASGICGAIYLYFLNRKKARAKKSKSARVWLSILAVVLAVLPCVGAIILFIMIVNIVDGVTTSRSRSYSSSSYSDSYDSSSSDSSSSFDGGGGGDSGGGGSDSDW